MAERSAPNRLPLLVIVLALVVIAAGLFVFLRRPGREVELPTPHSPDYHALVSAFYTGVVALDAGDTSGETGKPPRAEIALTRSTQLAPGEPATWGNLGLLELRLGDVSHPDKLQLAARYLDKAHALAPNNARIEEYLGQLAKAQNKPADAIAHFRRAIELEPKNVRAMYALGGPNGVYTLQGGPSAAAESKALMQQILTVQPNNLAAQLDLARVVADSGDAQTLRECVARMDKQSASWPANVRQRLDDLRKALQSGDARQASVPLQFFANMSKPLTEFRYGHERLEEVHGIIAPPIERFLKLPTPPSTPSPPDTGLTFAAQPAAGTGAPQPTWVASVRLNGALAPTNPPALPPDRLTPPVMVTADGRSVQVAGGPSLAFPGGASATPPSPAGVLAADINNDYLLDFVLAGAGGLKLYRQDASGTFADVTAKTTLPAAVTSGALYGVWPADVDMDGDLDLVVAPVSGPPVVLQNNNDEGTFAVVRPFQGVTDVRGFVWADLDNDGDQDAVFLDAQGGLHLFMNDRAGRFTPRALPTTLGKAVAIATADANRDGVLDLIVLQADGAAVRVSDKDEQSWDTAEIARWQSIPAGVKPGEARLFFPDLDLNGGIDLVASAPKATQIWLSDVEGRFQPLASPVNVQVLDVADVTNDGRLDLLELSDSGDVVQLVNHGAKPYRFQILRPRAMKTAKEAADQRSGDSRINAFAVGGMIEIRSGLLTQSQRIDGPLVHFGIGDHTEAEVARIVWPNGCTQAEYDIKPDLVTYTEQRPKGSCPWVFTWNGQRMEFVTDFLWSSPLGLRINAQGTAETPTTVDWVKIRGDQLAPKDGFYDVRITAELWETHFFDHVSLMAVDHPAGTEAWVDERFAIPPPKREVIPTGALHPFARAVDDNGQDVSDVVRERDGQCLGTFGRGQYQGITRYHFVELELGEDAPRSGPLWLIGQGWVNPTDSSINVAISQGKHDAPHGLSLEVADGKGGWRVARSNLGFPAGMNKTVLIDLSGVFAPGTPRRLRLRTNLEVYWDRLAWAAGLPSTPLKTQRIAPETAELRYRGYSAVRRANPSAPALPDYEDLAQTTPRWRDLIGFCTRFGDVKELLAKVDDRYVIMNAGDEMVLRFPALPPPPAGWTRDFVLIGDGWEKDGDYNTTFSKTVLPLPTHKSARYTTPPGRLEDDPVYRAHPDDWLRYHTRYVAPDYFSRTLRPAESE